jgi:hypothetical protein
MLSKLVHSSSLVLVSSLNGFAWFRIPGIMVSHSILAVIMGILLRAALRAAFRHFVREMPLYFLEIGLDHGPSQRHSAKNCTVIPKRYSEIFHFLCKFVRIRKFYQQSIVVI